ncbi:pantetheine-phosphate adenylyltransferase [Mycoplasma procyoni]|uniref:pantetheine-phosphate adenylyltransferase n=1 Tax=Mycoplasma procyoni TaxID=568784 RepID=UPI00197C8A1D|nr:pantetheine-phosphate adenylyltransferase [Mycoplasma procyoni]MBN3534573.1 pantetheine-phosphate adenylyltransferase [Mycoplasma procyoni]
MNKAIFPGSFDPFHSGHLNILQKAQKLFDYIYIIVTFNPDKDNNKDFEQKVQNVKEMTKELKNIEILVNQKELTGVLAKRLGVNFLIRSARDNIDFNYELELALGNKIVNSELETIIFFPDESTKTISSTLERHKRILGK